MPNDPVLVYYLLLPCMSQYIRLSCSFTHWVAYISPHHFVTLSNFWHFQYSPATFSSKVCFSLFSLLFLSFSKLPNTPLQARVSHPHPELSRHQPHQQQRRPLRLNCRLPPGSGERYSSGTPSRGMCGSTVKSFIRSRTMISQR